MRVTVSHTRCFLVFGLDGKSNDDIFCLVWTAGQTSAIDTEKCIDYGTSKPEYACTSEM